MVGSGSLAAAAAQSKFTAAAPRRDAQVEASNAQAAEDASALSQATAESSQVEHQVEPKWIDQEDAKMKKEEAKAKAKAKAKGKAKKKDRSADKSIAKKLHLEAIGNVAKLHVIDAELETNTGSESCLDTERFEKETVESQTVESIHEDTPERVSLQKPSPVRWSDLDDSSDDDLQPREIAASRMTMTPVFSR